MNQRIGRAFLILAASTMLAAAAFFYRRPPEFTDAKTPTEASPLANRIAHHPTDWAAASSLTEIALDSRIPTRVPLWHAAYEHAALLAPERKDPATAYARAAFFHWPELSEAEQRGVLAAYAPLLRDPGLFSRMAGPLLELTGDLNYLLRSGPGTASAIATLRDLALSAGRFDDYRALRTAVQRKQMEEFEGQAHTASPEELVAHFPPPPYHSSDEPLITALLKELHQRPLTEAPARRDVNDALIDYALRHEMGPLDGLEAISRGLGTAASSETRIKLARALGRSDVAAQIEMATNDPRHVAPDPSEWRELCGSDICREGWRTIEANHAIALTIQTVQRGDLPAYVEIYVDDVLRAEGEVEANRQFVLPVGKAGRHRVDVILANPTTRDIDSRRIHVSSITTL